MSSLKFDSIPRFAFMAEWEIGKAMFSENEILKTESKTLEGLTGVEWNLECNPNETRNDENENNNFICFYLNIGTSTKLNYSLFCKVNDYKASENEKWNKEIVNTAEDSDKILLIRLPHSEVFIPESKYFQNGKLCLRISGIFSNFNQTKKRYNYFFKYDLGSYLLQNENMDFKIKVEDQEIEVHKLVLAAESPVFKTMFESNFKEATEGQMTIPDFNFDTVKAAVDYIYAMDITAFVDDEENAFDLLILADKYDFQVLKPALELYLADKLTKENIGKIVVVADKSNAADLWQACINFTRPLLNNKNGNLGIDTSSFDYKFLKELVDQSLSPKSRP